MDFKEKTIAAIMKEILSRVEERVSMGKVSLVLEWEWPPVFQEDVEERLTEKELTWERVYGNFNLPPIYQISWEH